MSSEAPKALARHVDRLWPKDDPDSLPVLIESAEAVEKAIASPGFQAIKQVIDREIAQLDKKLDSDAEDIDYRRLHGRRSGLTAIDDAATAIIDGARDRRKPADEAAGESAAER